MDVMELRYGENSITIYDLCFNNEEYISGNPYNTTFKIKVISGNFSGACECEYDMAEFKKFVDAINDLYDFKNHEVELSEICYGSKILFKLDKTGHLKISGEIYGDAMIQSLKFEFEADQTSLKPFKDSLQRCIRDADIKKQPMVVKIVNRWLFKRQ